MEGDLVRDAEFYLLPRGSWLEMQNLVRPRSPESDSVSNEVPWQFLCTFRSQKDSLADSLSTLCCFLFTAEENPFTPHLFLLLQSKCISANW